MKEDLSLQRAQSILLIQNPVIIIGSSFKDDIYYQFKNLIRPSMGRLFWEDNSYIFEWDGKERKLNYGDEIRIHGLWILYLKNRILVCSHGGDFRVAGRKKYAS